jgi:hypothetical protein
MPECLKMLDQQSLGPFDRHRHPLTEPSQLSLQIGEPGDVVRHPQLGQPLADVIDHA